jgi:hypothetical protein
LTEIVSSVLTDTTLASSNHWNPNDFDAILAKELVYTRHFGHDLNQMLQVQKQLMIQMEGSEFESKVEQTKVLDARPSNHHHTVRDSFWRLLDYLEPPPSPLYYEWSFGEGCERDGALTGGEGKKSG